MASGHNNTEFTPTRRITNSLTLANTEAKRAAFIAALRNSGNVRASCQQAGISRRTAYTWRDKWVAFADDWAEALEDSCDVLEAEARRRGMSISDRLLMFLLKAHRPEVFGDKQKIDLRVVADNDLDSAIATELARLAGTSKEAVLRTAEDDADPAEAEP